MKDKPLEKSLNTEQEVIQFIADRYFEAIDKEIANYRKQLERIDKGKLPKEFTDPKNPDYQKDYNQMSLDEKKFLALCDLERSLNSLRNHQGLGTGFGDLRYCGLLNCRNYDKYILNPSLDRDRIIIKLFGDIHDIQDKYLQPKQIKVGSVCKFDNKKFKCVEWKDLTYSHFRCGMCDFDDVPTCPRMACQLFPCNPDEREDHKTVFFTEVKENQNDGT